MRRDKDKELVKKFPLLYRDRNGSCYDTCMCWGFPGDGWFNILEELSEKIESRIKILLNEQKFTAEDYPRAAQVKEKFGTLRFYMTHYDPEIEKYILESERKSAITCEDCGNPGKMNRDGYWMSVSCDACKQKSKSTSWQEETPEEV